MGRRVWAGSESTCWGEPPSPLLSHFFCQSCARFCAVHLAAAFTKCGCPVSCDHPLYLTNAFWQHPFGEILNIPIWKQIQVFRRKRKRKLCGGAPPARTGPELAPFHLIIIMGPLAQLEVDERTWSHGELGHGASLMLLCQRACRLITQCSADLQGEGLWHCLYSVHRAHRLLSLHPGRWASWSSPFHPTQVSLLCRRNTGPGQTEVQPSAG